MKKTILFLSPVSHFKGGAEKCLIDFWGNQEIHPILAAPEEGPLLKTARDFGIQTYVVPYGEITSIKRPFSFIKGVRVLSSLAHAGLRLKRLTKVTQAYVVHSNGLKAHVINCVSYRLGGAPAVLHIHDIPLTAQEKIVWKILHFLCDKMILVSRPCWPGSVLPRKCTVIHNGVVVDDSDHLQPFSDNGTLTAGFVGRIHPAKGLHLLLEWLAEARSKGFDLRLSVRGPFSEDAPDYLNNITKIIDRLKIKDFVEFKGYIEDPLLVYEGLDFVVVPSQTPDPLPRSVMEAMAIGLPVMGFPEGGIVEMIDDQINGFLVSDSVTFIKSLDYLRNNSETLKQAAKIKMRDEFSISLLHKRMNKIYSSVKA